MQNVSEDRKTQVFLNKLELYYENIYNLIVREEIATRLKNFSIDTLADIYRQIIATFPSQYNKLPDVSVLVKAIKDVEEVPGDFLALPQPNCIDRRRTLSEDESNVVKWYVRRLCETLFEGNPYEAFKEYVERYPNKAHEVHTAEKIQELLRHYERIRKEKSCNNHHDISRTEAGEGSVAGELQWLG